MLNGWLAVIGIGSLFFPDGWIFAIVVFAAVLAISIRTPRENRKLLEQANEADRRERKSG